MNHLMQIRDTANNEVISDGVTMRVLPLFHAAVWRGPSPRGSEHSPAQSHTDMPGLERSSRAPGRT